LGDLEDTILDVISSNFPYLDDLKALLPLTGLEDFIRHPRREVAALFVALLLFLANAIADRIYRVIAVFQEPFRAVSEVLLIAFGRPAAEVLNAVDLFNQLAQQLVIRSGLPAPVKPVALFLLLFGELAVLYYGARFAVGRFG